MLYKQDIATLALGHLGSSLPIADIETDNTHQAKVIRRHFRQALDKFLAKHAWGFAGKTAVLNILDTDPSPDYLFSYAMPADALVIRRLAADGIFPKVYQYEDEKERWEEFESASSIVLYSNVLNAHAEYTRRLADDAAFPQHFGDGLAAMLASRIGPQLITNNWLKMKTELLRDHKNIMDEAIADDLSRKPLPLDSYSPFQRARYK